jgi:hypothetical protein
MIDRNSISLKSESNNCNFISKEIVFVHQGDIIMLELDIMISKLRREEYLKEAEMERLIERARSEKNKTILQLIGRLVFWKQRKESDSKETSTQLPWVPRETITTAVQKKRLLRRARL